MTSSAQSYHNRQLARFFAPYDSDPNTRFAGILSQKLVDDLEWWKTARADLVAADYLPLVLRAHLEMLECDISDGEAELACRMRTAERLAGDPWAPRTPRRNDKLMDLARDLKAVWPIDRFCEDLMAMRLIKTGNRFRARCPLPGHDDVSPSFVLYPDQGRFHCFGCGRTGDVIDLTQHYFGISRFADAVRKLADESCTRLNFEEAS